MTDNDRTLLEKAAKAMWHGEIDDVVSIRWGDQDGCILYTHADNQDHNGIDREYRWNPLEENHDAFELAVKLNLTCRFYFGSTVAQATVPGGPAVYVTENEPTDVMCGARRAIVRAAAAIGDSHE